MAKKKTLRQKAQQVISGPGRLLNSVGLAITGRDVRGAGKRESARDVPRKFLTTEELEGFEPGTGIFKPRKKKSKK